MNSVDQVIIYTVYLTVISTISLLTFYAAFISFREKEKPAGRKLMFLNIIATAVLLLPIYLVDNPGSIMLIIMSGIFLLSFFFFVPFKGKRITPYSKPEKRIDERDIMFSRNELKKGSAGYKEYYSSNPDLEGIDNKFREKPGLMKPGSSKYHPAMFASADSTFETVDLLKKYVDGEPASEKQIFDSGDMTTYLKEWSKHLGAADCGVTLLEEHHKYSIIGRGEDYGKENNIDHKYALVFTVEMNNDMVKSAPSAPIIMESSKQYLEAGIIAVNLAAFIRKLGYRARAHIDGNYRVICPLVARDAGLGEIGRMGLLMTPKLGPRVRIGVVTTDIPLAADKIKGDETVIDFCERCRKCADVCPSGAIPFESRSMNNGTIRWQINSEACFTLWTSLGTDCGRCMAVCPYSHPDNPLHNFVRWGVRNNSNFRKSAVVMDDMLYGRKPPPFNIQPWMNIKKN